MHGKEKWVINFLRNEKPWRLNSTGSLTHKNIQFRKKKKKPYLHSSLWTCLSGVLVTLNGKVSDV